MYRTRKLKKGQGPTNGYRAVNNNNNNNNNLANYLHFRLKLIKGFCECILLRSILVMNKIATIRNIYVIFIIKSTRHVSALTEPSSGV
jgi:hypothetical protein